MIKQTKYVIILEDKILCRYGFKPIDNIDHNTVKTFNSKNLAEYHLKEVFPNSDLSEIQIVECEINIKMKNLEVLE